MAIKGIYILNMNLSKVTVINVGRLGAIKFPRGYYLYIGSAMSGFAGRINRHLKRKKTRRWHIDYLLEAVEILWVDLYETDSHEDECRLSAAIGELPGAKIVARGFGASDCKCRTHLYWFETLPSFRPEIPGRKK